MTYKVAAYLRLSKEEYSNEKESNSITNQKIIIDNYLKEHKEYKLIDYYIDDGCSGTNFDRPEFQRMLEDIKNKKKTTNGKMFWYLVVATIPAAIVGFLLDDVIENVIRNNIWLIASALAIMGMLIYLGDKWATHHYKKEKKFEDITLKEAIIIGISQAFAVIPGFSRSGTTILAGRLQGISKEAITKFTFLLSVPVICGATVLKVTDLCIIKIIGTLQLFLRFKIAF
jgi:undecaprenyl-diphosphatase UppP